MPHSRIEIGLKIICALVMTFLLCFWYDATTSIGSRPAQNATTQVTMRDILFSIMAYRRDHHEWPIDGERMALRFTREPVFAEHSTYAFKRMMREGSLDDSWGNPFFPVVSDDRFLLLSAGPDGLTNTADDITGCFLTDEHGCPLDASLTIIDPAEKISGGRFFSKQRKP